MQRRKRAGRAFAALVVVVAVAGAFVPAVAHADDIEVKLECVVVHQLIVSCPEPLRVDDSVLAAKPPIDPAILMNRENHAVEICKLYGRCEP